MDSVPGAHSAPPQVAATPTVGTVLGPGAVLEGTLWAAEPVRVLGTLRGTLEAERPVVVEAGGQVLARVSVPELVVAGLVDGPIHCAGRLEVRRGGQIKGRLQAGSTAPRRPRPARPAFAGRRAPAAES